MRIFFKYTLFYSTHIPSEGNQSDNRQCCCLKEGNKKKKFVVLQTHKEHSLTLDSGTHSLRIDMNAKNDMGIVEEGVNANNANRSKVTI